MWDISPRAQPGLPGGDITARIAFKSPTDPRAKQKIANGDAVVEQRLHEEHEANTVLKELEKLDVDSDEFTGS